MDKKLLGKLRGEMEAKFNKLNASPNGTYANLAALIAADPDHSRIDITLDDMQWCYHNGSAFVAGSVYLPTEADIDAGLFT